MGTNQYPRSMEETMNILNKYNKRKINQETIDSKTEMFFVQSNRETKIERDFIHITCYHCVSKGQYAKECPNKNNFMHITIADEENEDAGNSMTENIFYQMQDEILSKDWLLLDKVHLIRC